MRNSRRFNYFAENVKSFTDITNNNFQLTTDRKTLSDYKASRMTTIANLHLQLKFTVMSLNSAIWNSIRCLVGVYIS